MDKEFLVTNSSIGHILDGKAMNNVKPVMNSINNKYLDPKDPDDTLTSHPHDDTIRLVTNIIVVARTPN